MYFLKVTEYKFVLLLVFQTGKTKTKKQKQLI